MLCESTNTEWFLAGLGRHIMHTTVRVSAEHLATEEAQHSCLAIISIHHVVGTPGQREREGERDGGRRGERERERERERGKG